MARAETSGITDGHENEFAKSVDLLRAHLIRAYVFTCSRILMSARAMVNFLP